MSPEFVKLLAHARELGCSYVCIDRDGPDDIDLPQHEW